MKVALATADTRSPLVLVIHLDIVSRRPHTAIDREPLASALAAGLLLRRDPPQQGRALYKTACRLDLEGIVAKRKDRLVSAVRQKRPRLRRLPRVILPDLRLPPRLTQVFALGISQYQDHKAEQHAQS
jgi:hypothetical protein